MKHCRDSKLTVEAPWIRHEAECMAQIVRDKVPTASNRRNDDHATLLTLELLYAPDLDLIRDSKQLPTDLLYLGMIRSHYTDVVVG
jgi:hypothetical protein